MNGQIGRIYVMNEQTRCICCNEFGNDVLFIVTDKWRDTYAFIPYCVGLMFIRLCTTSKCNYFTYNTSLYTRERTRKRKQYDKRKEKEDEL